MKDRDGGIRGSEEMMADMESLYRVHERSLCVCGGGNERSGNETSTQLEICQMDCNLCSFSVFPLALRVEIA